MVGGHVNVGRFVSLFGVSNTITFLRDPLQRMVSEHAHFVRHYGYQGNFHDFYSRPAMHNRQSKLLHGVDFEAIGMVGLTERYAQSLEMLNANYGIEIPQREDNQGKASLDVAYAINPEDETKLRRLNARDIELYDHANELFEKRWQLFQDGMSWAHARLSEVNTSRVAGWAWWAEGGDEHVEVEVWVNGVCLDTVPSMELRPGLCRLLPPRGGYVGFHRPVKLAPGDWVQCRVATTGQWFPAKPSLVPEPEAK